MSSVNKGWKKFVPSAAIYVFHFSCVGIMITFLSPYLADLGFTGTQIGLLLSLPAVARVLSPLLWGYMADKTGRTVGVLRLVIVLSLLTPLLFLEARSFTGIAIILFVFASTKTAVPALNDAVTMKMIKQFGGLYSDIRVWGSIGFVVSAVVMGKLIEGSQDYAKLSVIALTGCYAITLIASLFLNSKGIEHKPVNYRSVQKLFENRRIVVLFLASSLHWASTMPYHGFLPVHVREIQMASSIAGVCFGVAGVAEIIMMSQSRRLFQIFKPHQLFALSLLVTGLRWFVMTLNLNESLLVAIQFLHAFTFTGFFVSAIEIILEEIPDELRATGQGLFFAASFGLGGGIGSVLAGYAFEIRGGEASFMVGGFLSLFALFVSRGLGPQQSDNG
ncbi:MAG: MFS transporter [Myxococcota bacterium]|nr:MFS transporter [Myxococcota bacterium]